MTFNIKRKIEIWIRHLVWEASQDASVHFKQPPDNTQQIVRLILDLHDKEWSYQSDAFLKKLNISPVKYEKKYWKGNK